MVTEIPNRASHPSPTGLRFLRSNWHVLLPGLLALLYAGGHLTWYLDTPLGRTPVLDENENLLLAEAIFNQSLPAEPFYRAPGYALGLAGLRQLGLTASGLFPTALLLGAGLHALNAMLLAQIAQTFFNKRAGLIAGLIGAMHPVLVHYSTQALDAVPALTLFLFGLVALKPSPAGPVRWAAVSLSWAAATMVRPSYLLVWLALFPIVLWLNAPGQRIRGLAAISSGILVYAIMALWQWHISGRPAVLPWQGAYNLWAANQPAGHGRYYTQQFPLPATLARQNPARIESLLRYEAATGKKSTDITAMNAYWLRLTVKQITESPAAWLGMLARKTYACFNNWEQYNNKTYAFHKKRSPWLTYNPLGWGMILVLGVAGAARLFQQSPRSAWIFAAIATVVLGSILPYYVSARFRLPLATMCVVLAAGFLATPGFWRGWPIHRQLALGFGVLLAAFVTFSGFNQVRSQVTYVQDHALLARAADTVGDDHVAWQEARAACALSPNHPDALRVAVAAYFNLMLAGATQPADETAWLEASRRLLATPAVDPPDLHAIAVLALWRSGDHLAARNSWHALPASPTSLAAQLLTGDDAVSPDQLAQLGADAWRQPLFQLAAELHGLPRPATLSQTRLDDPGALFIRLFHPAKIQ